MVADILYKKEISFIAKDVEMSRIQAVFTELKLINGLKKIELYSKALEWIAKDEKSKSKFMERLSKEKAQEQQLVISNKIT